jgi:hypothetical protein
MLWARRTQAGRSQVGLLRHFCGTAAVLPVLSNYACNSHQLPHVMGPCTADWLIAVCTLRWRGQSYNNGCSGRCAASSWFHRCHIYPSSLRTEISCTRRFKPGTALQSLHDWKHTHWRNSEQRSCSYSSLSGQCPKAHPHCTAMAYQNEAFPQV